MQWRQFVMNLESIDLSSIETVLLQSGAQSVTLTDAGDDPVLEPAPGEMPLWADTSVTALFQADTNFEDLRNKLRSSLGRDTLPPNRVEDLADKVWEREWLCRFGPMQFGRRLWIVPGEEAFSRDGAVVVRLDPGLAFGTGTHATTSLCLAWLENNNLAGAHVFDFGCGSGILGIAALKLGAAAVNAVDIDLQAVSATRQNAERNEVDGQLVVSTSIPSVTPQYDFVVANILARTLIEHAATICCLLKPGGKLALSGVLADQVDDVRRHYWHAVEFEPTAIQDGWARLDGVRNGD